MRSRRIGRLVWAVASTAASVTGVLSVSAGRAAASSVSTGSATPTDLYGQVIDAGAIGSLNGQLDAVSCPTVSFCLAVGSFKDTAGDITPTAAQWNGTRWHLEAVADFLESSQPRATRWKPSTRSRARRLRSAWPPERP